MTDNPVSQDQRARWLTLAEEHDADVICDGVVPHYVDFPSIGGFNRFCTTIAAEAVEAEHQRLGLHGEPREEMTDAEIIARWYATPDQGPEDRDILFARALIAEASARAMAAERERVNETTIAEYRAALRNMADAYVRRVKTNLTSEEIAKEPWRCAEYVEAERLIKRPLKLQFSKEWLMDKIKNDPDLPCEVGVAAWNPEEEMTNPQHARWLELVEARAYRKHDNSFEMTETEAFALCAAIAAEAVAAERDRERLAERERCARWKPINHDARSGKRMLVLVRQPVPTFGGGGIFIARWTDRICDRGEDRGRAWFNDADQEIRLDVTHWMPLPDGPSAAAHCTGEE